jgi:hypothetical protein
MDYCTAWPEGWPIWLGGTEFAVSCKIHDEFYAKRTSLYLSPISDRMRV